MKSTTSPPIVLVGCGDIARSARLPACRKAGFEVWGAADADPHRARALADDFALARIFESTAAAIEAAPTDAVFDLAVPAASGIMWLSGDESGAPVPMGLSVADLIAGAHLTQGILACLVRRGVTGAGGRVEVSLLESVLDLQFELLTTHLNDGRISPRRSATNNGNPYLGAPYGLYRTSDGFLAIAMTPVAQLGSLLDCAELERHSDPRCWFSERDAIKGILAIRLAAGSTQQWLDRLEPAGIWCATVLTWPELLDHPAFHALDMLQDVARTGSGAITTTRCPIRINGGFAKSSAGAPRLGEHTEAICREFGL